MTERNRNDLVRSFLATENPLGECRRAMAMEGEGKYAFWFELLAELCDRLDVAPERGKHTDVIASVWSIAMTHLALFGGEGPAHRLASDLQGRYLALYLEVHSEAGSTGASIEAASLQEDIARASNLGLSVPVFGSLILARMAPDLREGLLSDEGLEALVREPPVLEDLSAPAAHALARRGRWDLLRTVMEIADANARRAVVEVCGTLPGEASDELLLLGLHDSEWWVVAEALASACARPVSPAVVVAALAIPTRGEEPARYAFEATRSDIEQAFGKGPRGQA